MAKGGFGTIYKAIWKDGFIDSWDSENNHWKRRKTYSEDYENFPVVLKCLHKSQDITADFLREVSYLFIFKILSSYKCNYLLFWNSFFRLNYIND